MKPCMLCHGCLLSKHFFLSLHVSNSLILTSTVSNLCGIVTCDLQVSTDDQLVVRLGILSQQLELPTHHWLQIHVVLRSLFRVIYCVFGPHDVGKWYKHYAIQERYNSLDGCIHCFQKKHTFNMSFLLNLDMGLPHYF